MQPIKNVQNGGMDIHVVMHALMHMQRKARGKQSHMQMYNAYAFHNAYEKGREEGRERGNAIGKEGKGWRKHVHECDHMHVLVHLCSYACVATTTWIVTTCGQSSRVVPNH